MTSTPDRKTVGYRVTLTFDVPLGEVTWHFATKADESGIVIGDPVAVPEPKRGGE